MLAPPIFRFRSYRQVGLGHRSAFIESLQTFPLCHGKDEGQNHKCKNKLILQL